MNANAMIAGIETERAAFAAAGDKDNVKACDEQLAYWVGEASAIGAPGPDGSAAELATANEAIERLTAELATANEAIERLTAEAAKVAASGAQPVPIVPGSLGKGK
jgi:hypothetical protein